MQTTGTATEAINTLAARLYTAALKLQEQPFVGSGTEISEFIIQLMEDARSDLNLFLTIHADVLDQIDIWAEIREASATSESWDAYGS